MGRRIVSFAGSFHSAILAAVLALALEAETRSLVDIITADNVHSELQTKLERLKDDLIDDGYTARISRWSGGRSDRDVWEHLKDAYDNDDLQGALLVGHIPVASGGNTDLPYWNMDSYLATIGSYKSSLPMHIWVSRIYAPPGVDEIAHLSNALDANHYYRTGQSRLPHKVWIHSCLTGDNGYCKGAGAGLDRSEVALDTWSESEAVDYKGMREAVFNHGGEILDEQAHGSERSYATVGYSDVKEKGCKIRFVFAASCHSGALGGVLNWQTIAPGTFNVLSIGGTDDVYYPAFILMDSDGSGSRARIRAGDSWGMALLADYPFNQTKTLDRTMMYGDLSLRPNHKGHTIAPENAIPEVSLNVKSGKTRVGIAEEVTFIATINDPDGDPVSVEWYLDRAGDGSPDHTMENVSNGAITLTWSYTVEGRHKPYVRVRDPWLAHQQSEPFILEASDPEETNLKNLVSAANPDLVVKDANVLGDKGTVALGSPGEGHLHVWDLSPFSTSRPDWYTFTNNHTGRGLCYDGMSGTEDGSVIMSDHGCGYTWLLIPASDDAYRIGHIYGSVDGFDSTYLTASDVVAGAGLEFRRASDNDAQRWFIRDYHDGATNSGSDPVSPAPSVNCAVRNARLHITMPVAGQVSIGLFNAAGRCIAVVFEREHLERNSVCDLSTYVPANQVSFIRISGPGFRRVLRALPALRSRN
ncbi:MAG: hypothetical protein GF344_16070 [Chitinivibrionales bacterium]|nr:hypothetical protein [Chitinivibrionales bacterium]MBD3358212.1 hypothetical protein [Chitinivibrionales bacterium]